MAELFNFSKKERSGRDFSRTTPKSPHSLPPDKSRSDVDISCGCRLKINELQEQLNEDYARVDIGTSLTGAGDGADESPKAQIFSFEIFSH